MITSCIMQGRLYHVVMIISHKVTQRGGVKKGFEGKFSQISQLSYTVRNGYGNWELLPPSPPKEKVLFFVRCPQILIECPVEINSDLEWTSFLLYFFQYRFGSQKLKWTPQIFEGGCGRHQCFYLLLTAPLKAIALMPLSLASTYPLIFPDQNTKR